MRVIRIAIVVVICLTAGIWLSQRVRIAAPERNASFSAVSSLPDFTLPDLDGRKRSIREWADRPLIINFWATWCAPCRREMPLLQDLYATNTNRSLNVVGVALDNEQDVRRFIEQIGVTYPILYGEDAGARAADSFGDSFVGLPFSAFVAPGGEVLALRAGELYTDELARLIAELDAVASGERSAEQARVNLSDVPSRTDP